MRSCTEDKEDEVKDVFYEQLEQTYGSLPAYDMKLVLGHSAVKWVMKTYIWEQ